MRAKLFTLVVILAAASQMGATGGDGCTTTTVIRDPGFDLWCGDTLCTWKLVTGEIKKAPTWHDKDAGVAFLGPEAIIEQVAPVDSSDGHCIEFDLVANVDETAQVQLDIDVSADGTIDRTERIPTSSWKPIKFLIKLDGNYRGIRFQLAKHGTGTATLAQIAANTVLDGNCNGFEAIVAAPAPNGAWCDSNTDCTSGVCDTVSDPAFFGSIRACVGCAVSAPAMPPICEAGTVCGTIEPTSFVQTIVPACVPASGDAIGERCRVDEECASGLCTLGVCSSCTSFSDCASGGGCRVAYPNGPTTCGGGSSGDACAADGDCVSGRCEGTPRKECADGRACASPANCPVVEDGTLEPGACTLVGVQGGTCF